MRNRLESTLGKKTAGAFAIAAMTAALVFAPAAIGAKAPGNAATGAPAKGDVRFSSQLKLPPDAWSLICLPGMTGCSTSGQITYATEAETEVAYHKVFKDAYGLAPLEYTEADGTVNMTFSCGDGLYTSQVTPQSTEDGQLEVENVVAEKGANTLAVTLNPGGDLPSVEEFPREIIERTDGAPDCGSPLQTIDQETGTWYYNFWHAHFGEVAPGGEADLELRGLAFRDGAFTKTYERGVQVAIGANTYTVEELTKIEVEPEWCKGQINRISSAVSNGESMGLSDRFYAGQVITAQGDSKIKLGDGSVIELKKGDKFQVEECFGDETDYYLPSSVGRFWANVKKALAGSESKFEVVTDRAVAGVRGTIFQVSYDKRKQLTKVKVKEGTVSLEGINGAKGKVMVKAGQVGIQKGKQAPKIVKG